MRRPRVRFTLRSMMVAVAVVGILLGVATMAERRSNYLGRARSHLRMADEFARQADDEEALAAAGGEKAAWWAGRAGWLRKQAAEHARFRLRYERASRRPWLPVAPDPTSPK